jgi:hypothetical protein
MLPNFAYIDKDEPNINRDLVLCGEWRNGVLEMFPAIWPDYALAHKANVIEMLSQVQKTIS